MGSGPALFERDPQGLCQNWLSRLPLPDSPAGSALRQRGAQLHVPAGTGGARLHAGDDVRGGALHGPLHQCRRGVHGLLQVDKSAALHPHHDLLGPALLRGRLAQPQAGAPLHGRVGVAGADRCLRRLHVGHRVQHRRGLLRLHHHVRLLPAAGALPRASGQTQGIRVELQPGAAGAHHGHPAR